MSSSAIVAGGGPGGLYLAWRLLTDARSDFDDVKILEMSPERIGGRIHTQTFASNDFVDLGGMRFANTHQVLEAVIDGIGYDRNSVVDFVECDVRMLNLRGQTIYSNSITSTMSRDVPYYTSFNNVTVDTLFNDLSQAVAGSQDRTRSQWCYWIETATLPSTYSSDVYPSGPGGAKVSNIGYWNLIYDYFNDVEAYHYCADAGGYQSNVINWNAADAIPYNGEFGASTEYLRFKGGYTTFIDKLHQAIVSSNGNVDPVIFNQRVMSFDYLSGVQRNSIVVSTENTDNPEITREYSADYLFLCMPRRSVELIAQTAKDNSLAQGLNDAEVKLYLESVIEQPSYKIGLSCNTNWFERCTFRPNLSSPSNAWGPTVTDLPLRQIYYFTPEDDVVGSNYGILASYDDMRYTTFWQQFELPTDTVRKVAKSNDFQPLYNTTPITDEMKRMVALQLAHVHYNTTQMQNGFNTILNSITDGCYMDWSLNPFGAGYHAWDAHYEICDVMQNIRQPLALMSSTPEGADRVFLSGSAYSNDQAWVEGAFCTAESVLDEYFGFTNIVNTTGYPLICACS